jgi:hypothetical protein
MIIEMARTMLDEYKSPHNFWGEAIATAVHVSNRLFLRSVYNKTPYELLTGNKPNVSYFRVFGCKCFIKNKERLGKFESRTIEGIFVGYAHDSHAYRYYNKSSGCVEVSCDVVFEEFNGSQEEQVVPSDVGYGESSQVIKSMGIGHILPCEDFPSQDTPHEEDSRLTQVEPRTTQVEPSSPSQVEQDSQEETHAQEQPPSPQPHEQDQGDVQEPPSSQDQAQEDGHDQDKPQEEFVGHDGLKRRIKAATKASDLQVDKILGDISKGVSTYRQLALLATDGM